MEVKGFSGYSSASSLLLTPINTFRKMSNCLVIKGALEKRKAFKAISSPGKGVISGFREFKFGAGTRGILYKQAASPYKWWTQTDASLSTATDLGASTGSPTNDPSFAFYKDILYTVDGTTVPRKLVTIGGTVQFIRHGLNILNTTWTPGVAAGGFLTTTGWSNGIYNYALTFEQTTDQGVIESNWVFAGNILIVTGVTLSPVISAAAAASPPPGMSAVNVYRQDVADGQTNYYFLGRVATTTGAFTYTDDSTGAGAKRIQNFTISAPLNNTQISTAVEVMTIHKDRGYYGLNNVLTFSSVGYPDYVPALNTMVVGTSDDKIVGLQSFPGYLLIVKQKSFWMLEGNSFADFNLRPISTMGTSFRKTWVYHDDSFYFINQSGIYRWPIGGTPDNIGNQIFADFDAIASEFLVGAVIAVEPENNHIWVALTSDEIFVYDPDINRFIGVINIASPASCMAKVGVYANQSRMAVFYNDGVLRSYNEVSGVAGTAETSFSFEAYTGMVFMDGVSHAVEKLAKSWSVYDRKALTISAGDEETPSFYINAASDAALKQIDSFQLNDKSIKTKGATGGRSFFAAGLVISGTGTVGKEWAITGINIEYEKIGHSNRPVK